MVKEMMSRLSKIHCLCRLVDGVLCLRIGFSGADDVLEVVSVLGLGLLKFSLTAFLVSGTAVVLVGGGGKYIGAFTFLSGRPALNEGSISVCSRILDMIFVATRWRPAPKCRE